MSLTDIQQLIVNSLSKGESVATRSLSVALGLSSPCVRNNAHTLIQMGLVVADNKKSENSPLKIRLAEKQEEKQEPINFSRVLFGTKW